MDKASEVASLLDQHKAELVRKNKHIVWRLPNGSIFVQSTTPGDRATPRAELTTLRRLLGLTSVNNGDGQRRARKYKPGRERDTLIAAPTFNSVLADQLRVSGVVENVLRDERDDALAEVAQLTAENELIREELEQLATEVAEQSCLLAALCAPKPPTWWERVKRRLRWQAGD